MRIVVLATLLCLAVAAQGAPPAGAELHPGVPVEVFAAPGRATTVVLHTSEKIASISLASPVITCKYDRSLNQLEITPAVRHGGVETNLNLRIGGSVYILLVKVVEDVRAQYLRDFTLAGEPSADDEAELARARPLAPAEVDIVGAARSLERAEGDPVYRQAHPSLRIEPIGHSQGWNSCQIRLEEAAQFLDLDLLVFRVRWLNGTADALYLDPTQYGLTVAGRKIPIIARYHPGAGPVIFPGRMETVYLAVQGYRLSRHNDWRLVLPLDASGVARAVPSRQPGAAVPSRP